MFHKKKDDGIVVLKATPPNVCGGTDATLDTKAPKEIASEEMTLFDATSALGGGELGFVSAFAVPAEAGGTFLFLETGAHFRRGAEKERAWALVKENCFPALVRLVRECELAKKNGYHSETHGLPENFGGRVRVGYASGEEIAFSDNQTPVLTGETGRKIAALFRKAMKGEPLPLPDVSALREIRFSERRKDGGYTEAILTIRQDGTGENAKKQRFGDGQPYESRKPVGADTVAAIKAGMKECGVLAWAGLPGNGFSFGEDKRLTFAFADGTERTVLSGRLLPDRLSGGFFDVELELTTKH